MMERREFLISSVAVPALLLRGTVVGRQSVSTGPSAHADARFEKLAQLVTEKMAEYRIPGVAFGVIKDGQTLMRGFGVTSIEDPQAITPDTIFQIASISKMIAATAMMRLVEQGRVALRAPVRQYLPDFRVRDETASREVTVWHLLTHMSAWENRLMAQDRGSETLAVYAKSMSDFIQLAPIGAVWSYNSAGFALTGRIIEVITGTDIHQALRDLVFTPLGLSRASAHLGDVVTHRVALGHRPRAAGVTEVVRPFLMGSSVPAGGVAMSLANLLSFADFHLGKQGVASGQLLSLATRELMRTPQIQKHATTDEMGLGWHLRTLNGVLTAAHGGAAGAGHRLLLQLVPARGLAFAILTNHTEGWRLIQDVERETLRAYEGLSLSPNQVTAHRGVNEAMTAHASPLRVQPSFEEYIGRYQRPPIGMVEVRTETGVLVIDSSGTRSAGRAISFYGRDVAYSTSETSAGTPYEFIRTANGDVGWIRVNGQIASRDRR